MKDILENEYKLDIKNIEKNEQSTDGNVYIIYTEKEKYVFKIYTDMSRVEKMIQLYPMLKEYSINTPEIIETIYNKEYIKFENKYIVLYSYMNGNQIGWNKLEDKIIKQIAEILKRLHCKTKGENILKLDTILFDDRKLDKSILHFDITRNNLFINNDKIGIIDFDDVKFGPSVYDVAIAVTNLFFSKTHGMDLDGARKFIEYYYEGETIRKNKEIELIKEYAIKWIDCILNENKLDSSTEESLEIKKQLIEKYL